MSAQQTDRAPKLNWGFDSGVWRAFGVNGCSYQIDIEDDGETRRDGKFSAWQQDSSCSHTALGRRAKQPPVFSCLCDAKAAIEAYDHKHQPKGTK